VQDALARLLHGVEECQLLGSYFACGSAEVQAEVRQLLQDEHVMRLISAGSATSSGASNSAVSYSGASSGATTTPAADAATERYLLSDFTPAATAQPQLPFSVLCYRLIQQQKQKLQPITEHWLAAMQASQQRYPADRSQDLDQDLGYQDQDMAWADPDEAVAGALDAPLEEVLPPALLQLLLRHGASYSQDVLQLAVAEQLGAAGCSAQVAQLLTGVLQGTVAGSLPAAADAASSSHPLACHAMLWQSSHPLACHAMLWQSSGMIRSLAGLATALKGRPQQEQQEHEPSSGKAAQSGSSMSQLCAAVHSSWMAVSAEVVDGAGGLANWAVQLAKVVNSWADLRAIMPPEARQLELSLSVLSELASWMAAPLAGSSKVSTAGSGMGSAPGIAASSSTGSRARVLAEQQLAGLLADVAPALTREPALLQSPAGLEAVVQATDLAAAVLAELQQQQQQQQEPLPKVPRLEASPTAAGPASPGSPAGQQRATASTVPASAQAVSSDQVLPTVLQLVLASSQYHSEALLAWVSQQALLLRAGCAMLPVVLHLLQLSGYSSAEEVLEDLQLLGSGYGTSRVLRIMQQALTGAAGASAGASAAAQDDSSGAGGDSSGCMDGPVEDTAGLALLATAMQVAWFDQQQWVSLRPGGPPPAAGVVQVRRAMQMFTGATRASQLQLAACTAFLRSVLAQLAKQLVAGVLPAAAGTEPQLEVQLPSDAVTVLGPVFAARPAAGQAAAAAGGSSGSRSSLAADRQQAVLVHFIKQLRASGLSVQQAQQLCGHLAASGQLPALGQLPWPGEAAQQLPFDPFAYLPGYSELKQVLEAALQQGGSCMQVAAKAAASAAKASEPASCKALLAAVAAVLLLSPTGDAASGHTAHLAAELGKAAAALPEPARSLLQAMLGQCTKALPAQQQGSSSSGSSTSPLFARPATGAATEQQQLLLQSVALHAAIQAACSAPSSFLASLMTQPGTLAAQHLPGMASDEAAEVYQATVQAWGETTRYRWVALWALMLQVAVDGCSQAGGGCQLPLEPMQMIALQVVPTACYLSSYCSRVLCDMPRYSSTG
jgi:hypothetical protein